jgi:hypothetical protein
LTFARFDPTATVFDEHGRTVRYVDTPLDQEYRVNPPDLVSEGMLPPEDFEMRRAVAEMKLATEYCLRVGPWQRLIGTAKARGAKALALKKQGDLRLLVQKSPEHRAALQRIIRSMPKYSGGPEALASYLKPVAL